jgi:hypothetical protein
MQDDAVPEAEHPGGRQGIPAAVRIAGTIWIIFGAVILLSAVLVPILTVGAEWAAGRPAAQARTAWFAWTLAYCFGLFIALFGVAFIFVGIQSVRGTARDTLGNGIGSIVFAIFNLGSGFLQLSMEQFVPAVVGISAGIGLLLAGILALVGRADYKAWREANQPRLAGGQREQ